MTPNLLILADSPAAFRELICDSIRQLLPAVAGQLNPNGASDEAAGKLMTRKETSKEFNISLTTLSQWTSRGLVPFVRLGRRVYFERERVIEAGRAHQRYQHKRK